MIQSRLFQKALMLLFSIFTLMMLIIFLITSFNLQNNIEMEYKEKGLAIATSIADSSVELLLNSDVATVQSAVDQFTDISGVSYVYVVTEQNEIVSHTFVPLIPQTILERLNTPQQDKLNISYYNIPAIGEIMDIAAPILHGELGTVHIGMNLDQVHGLIYKAIFHQQFVLLGLFILSFFLVYRYMNTISKPLNTLNDYAKSLSASKYETPLPQQGNIIKIAKETKNEIGDLSKTFIHLENTVIDYIHNLKETTSEKERIESELSIAKDIQLNMLPKILPPFPNRNDLLMQTYIKTAKEVGGDFYDFFLHEKQNKFYFSVGDVSGKGVPAALFMAVTSTLLRYTASRTREIVEMVTEVNRMLCENNESQHFVTLFLGILDLNDGTIEYCSAGHDLPFVLKQTGYQRLERTNNIALGVLPEAEYTAKTYQLQPKDHLLIYTDGITEAIDGESVIYTSNRLEKLFRTQFASPTALIDTIIRDVDTFVGDAPQADDITLFALQWRG